MKLMTSALAITALLAFAPATALAGGSGGGFGKSGYSYSYSYKSKTSIKVKVKSSGGCYSCTPCGGPSCGGDDDDDDDGHQHHPGCGHPGYDKDKKGNNGNHYGWSKHKGSKSSHYSKGYKGHGDD